MRTVSPSSAARCDNLSQRSKPRPRQTAPFSSRQIISIACFGSDMNLCAPTFGRDIQANEAKRWQTSAFGSDIARVHDDDESVRVLRVDLEEKRIVASARRPSATASAGVKEVRNERAGRAPGNLTSAEAHHAGGACAGPDRECQIRDTISGASNSSCGARSRCRSDGIPGRSLHCKRAPRSGLDCSADRRRRAGNSSRFEPASGGVAAPTDPSRPNG